MERLTARDTEAILGFLREVYSCLDVDGFIGQASRALRRLVPADRCSYNEMHPGRGWVRMVFEPRWDAPAPLLEALRCYAHQNPILAYYRVSERGEVRTFSDVLSPVRLRRLSLYAEYYRHVGVEEQIIVPLSLGSSRKVAEIGFALSRQGRDFSGRDRRVLELLQPHLMQALANARATARLSRLECALETEDRGVILLDDETDAVVTGRRSRALLAKYFGDVCRRDRLPESLVRWVKAAGEALAARGDLPPARPHLVREREGRRLMVRLVGHSGQRMLLLEERSLSLEPASLAPLGLTRRESEVLAWVCDGKTNGEIGAILGARSATVAKHLERIYQKLGVETRTAAAAQALSATGFLSLLG